MTLLDRSSEMIFNPFELSQQENMKHETHKYKNENFDFIAFQLLAFLLLAFGFWLLAFDVYFDIDLIYIYM